MIESHPSSLITPYKPYNFFDKIQTSNSLFLSVSFQHFSIEKKKKGEITILSGNEDVIQIRTSIQAKESILKNAAALEPVQDGNQYTYTIHTPLEEKLERSVTFQVFVTIPRQLDSLE